MYYYKCLDQYKFKKPYWKFVKKLLFRPSFDFYYFFCLYLPTFKSKELFLLVRLLESLNLRIKKITNNFFLIYSYNCFSLFYLFENYSFQEGNRVVVSLLGIRKNLCSFDFFYNNILNTAISSLLLLKLLLFSQKSFFTIVTNAYCPSVIKILTSKKSTYK